MSYLKSVGTSFVYIVFVLALITFTPGLEPAGEFSEYSIKPPAELVGVLAQNDRLNGPEILFSGELKGPESFDSYNGELYTGMHGGYVGKIAGKKIIPVVKFGKKCEGVWEEDKCGRPLGLKFDKQGRLYVADAYYGIFKVDVKTGKYEKLFDVSQPIDGKVPMFVNSVDVANNGDVYWTDSSTQFKLFDGIYAMFTDPTGRLIRYNAATKKNEVLLKNLGMANGLKLSDDESYVIVAETMKSTVLKYHLKGPKAGKSEVFVDGLPGTPDNIHSDGQGNYLVSLFLSADPEHPQLSQSLTPHPYIRKLIARVIRLVELPFVMLDKLYPNDFAKKAIHAVGSFESFGFLFPPKATILRIDGNGKILDALHNSDEKISAISSAFIHDNYLWLGSPFNQYLARVPLKQAFPNSEFLSKATEKPRVVREVKVTPQVEKPAATPKVETPTTPKPAATPKIETATTPKPAATPKVETATTSKPAATKPAAKPTPTEAPKMSKTEKVDKVKPVSKDQKETDKKQQAGNVPKKVVETAKAPKKVDPVKQTNELPKPIKQAEPIKPPKQAPTAKASKQPEAAKPPKKTEPVKRNTKLADEI